MTEKNPTEITRDTLRLLGTRKLTPNPANFRAVYNEVAGVPDTPPFPDGPLHKIVHVLPARTVAQHRFKAQLESAVRRANWGDLQSALLAYVQAGVALAARAPAARAEPSVSTDLFESLARLIENALPAFGTDDARIVEQGASLLQALRGPAAAAAATKGMLTNFTLRVSFAAEDQAEIRSTLLKLLRLVFENIGELSRDDPWLSRQVETLKDATNPPLTLRRLDDVERRVRDVMIKQAMAHGRAVEAQEQMRSMVALFIERLAQMTASTGEQHQRMEESARQIEQAKSLEEIAPVLKEVVVTTRDIAQAVRRTHDELNAMRERVQATEAEINRLHDELDNASAQATHDSLTGALNRKGLDEALVRELAEVRRRDTPLCVSLLDIDNFKKLNDTHGHATGDAALAHLVAVTRESMRPKDTLARYGGEEFVILMPDTVIEQAVETMTRLQRQLTRRFFLDGDEKIVITFSAGVVQLAPDESAEDAINRADQAMYLAKRAGRNRVIGA